MNRSITILLTTFVLFQSCQTSNQGKYKIVSREGKSLINDTSRLSLTLYDSLRNFLATTGSKSVNDTIVIRFTSSGDDCWSYWNDKPDSAVAGMARHQIHFIDSIMNSRPHISFYAYRNSGNDFTKFISRLPRINVDSTNWLFSSIVKVHSRCGTSVVIFPDRTLLRFLVDPHYELLFANQADWERFFKQAKNKTSN